MERTDIIFDIETTGLDPLTDRVVSIGVKVGAENTLIMDKDEAAMLNQFWGGLRSYEWFRLVSFNGSTFDIPFLNIRSLLHSMKVVDVRGKHIDLRFVLNYGQKFGNGKLQEYADFLGIAGKYEGIDGSAVPLLYANGDFEMIERYAIQDVETTFELLQRAKQVGLV
ncbi:ribonuclease H-like domain-containing protein [Candidatus Woesearchaeota archaeon]|nr:ribonuclease H-like domain-containing protein [Candidatus Woesearchaeota archaeon]